MKNLFSYKSHQKLDEASRYVSASEKIYESCQDCSENADNLRTFNICTNFAPTNRKKCFTPLRSLSDKADCIV